VIGLVCVGIAAGESILCPERYVMTCLLPVGEDLLALRRRSRTNYLSNGRDRGHVTNFKFWDPTAERVKLQSSRFVHVGL